MSSPCDGASPSWICDELKSRLTTPTSCFWRFAFGAVRTRWGLKIKLTTTNKNKKNKTDMNSLVRCSDSRCSMSDISSPGPCFWRFPGLGDSAETKKQKYTLNITAESHQVNNWTKDKPAIHNHLIKVIYEANILISLCSSLSKCEDSRLYDCKYESTKQFFWRCHFGLWKKDSDNVSLFCD